MMSERVYLADATSEDLWLRRGARRARKSRLYDLITVQNLVILLWRNRITLLFWCMSFSVHHVRSTRTQDKQEATQQISNNQSNTFAASEALTNGLSRNGVRAVPLNHRMEPNDALQSGPSDGMSVDAVDKLAEYRSLNDFVHGDPMQYVPAPDSFVPTSLYNTSLNTHLQSQFPRTFADHLIAPAMKQHDSPSRWSIAFDERPEDALATRPAPGNLSSSPHATTAAIMAALAGNNVPVHFDDSSRDTGAENGQRRLDTVATTPAAMAVSLQQAQDALAESLALQGRLMTLINQAKSQNVPASHVTSTTAAPTTDGHATFTISTRAPATSQGIVTRKPFSIGKGVTLKPSSSIMEYVDAPGSHLQASAQAALAQSVREDQLANEYAAAAAAAAAAEGSYNIDTGTTPIDNSLEAEFWSTHDDSIASNNVDRPASSLFGGAHGASEWTSSRELRPGYARVPHAYKRPYWQQQQQFDQHQQQQRERMRRRRPPSSSSSYSTHTRNQFRRPMSAKSAKSRHNQRAIGAANRLNIQAYRAGHRNLYNNNNRLNHLVDLDQNLGGSSSSYYPVSRYNRHNNNQVAAGSGQYYHYEGGGSGDDYGDASGSHQVVHVHSKEKKGHSKYLWPIVGGGLSMLMGFLIISNMLLSVPLLAIGAQSLFNQGGGGYHSQQLVPVYNLSQLATASRPPGGRRRRRRRKRRSLSEQATRAYSANKQLWSTTLANDLDIGRTQPEVWRWHATTAAPFSAGLLVMPVSSSEDHIVASMMATTSSTTNRTLAQEQSKKRSAKMINTTSRVHANKIKASSTQNSLSVHARVLAMRPQQISGGGDVGRSGTSSSSSKTIDAKQINATQSPDEQINEPARVEPRVFIVRSHSSSSAAVADGFRGRDCDQHERSQQHRWRRRRRRRQRPQTRQRRQTTNEPKIVTTSAATTTKTTTTTTTTTSKSATLSSASSSASKALVAQVERLIDGVLLKASAGASRLLGGWMSRRGQLLRFAYCRTRPVQQFGIRQQVQAAAAVLAH